MDIIHDTTAFEILSSIYRGEATRPAVGQVGGQQGEPLLDQRRQLIELALLIGIVRR